MAAIEPYREPERPVIISSPLRGDGPDKEDKISVPNLVAAFRRRLRLFLAVLGGTIALTIVFLLVSPPRYTATARVTINTRAISTTPDKETPVVAQLPIQSSADVDTEVEIIHSRRVVQRVVDMLQLDKDREFSSSRIGPVAMFTYFFAPIKARSKQDEVVNAVLANLLPARFLATDAIDINFTDNNPKKAQRIANAFAHAYLADQVQAKYQQSRDAASGILAQIDTLRERADADSAAVNDYKIKHNLMSVGQVTLTEQEISTYNEGIAAAKAEAASDQANLDTAREQLAHGSNGGDVGEALSSPVVGALREQRAAVSAKLASLQGHYGPLYPDMAQARQQLADLDQEINAEIERTISNLSAKAIASQKRLEAKEATLAATKLLLTENNLAETGLDNLARQAAISQAIYEAYLTRSKETIAQASNVLPDAQIVSLAGLPESPSFPIPLLFVPLGIVAGILFGCAAILVAELNENRLLTPEDVEAYLGQRYLGPIPLLASVSKARKLAPADAVLTEPASAYGEAFRSLRAAIGISSPGPGPSVVLVTSALPQEGKTTVALGLARTSALQGVSTVIVDCDVRRQGLTRMLKLDNRQPGLMDVLAGFATLEQALVIDRSSGANILPIGMGDQSPHQMLGGEAMDHLLSVLRDKVRIVILDSAPILPIAATRVLSVKADAVVMVVQWRKTAEAVVRTALRLLPQEHGRLVGIVLARVDIRQIAKYGGVDAGGFFKKFRQYYG